MSDTIERAVSVLLFQQFHFPIFNKKETPVYKTDQMRLGLIFIAVGIHSALNPNTALQCVVYEKETEDRKKRAMGDRSAEGKEIWHQGDWTCVGS